MPGPQPVDAEEKLNIGETFGKTQAQFGYLGRVSHQNAR